MSHWPHIALAPVGVEAAGDVVLEAAIEVVLEAAVEVAAAPGRH